MKIYLLQCLWFLAPLGLTKQLTQYSANKNLIWECLRCEVHSCVANVEGYWVL